MNGFRRRLKSVVTDESRIGASADPVYLIEKPHLFGRSLAQNLYITLIRSLMLNFLDCYLNPLDCN